MHEMMITCGLISAEMNNFYGTDAQISLKCCHDDDDDVCLPYLPGIDRWFTQ